MPENQNRRTAKDAKSAKGKHSKVFPAKLRI